MELMQKIVSAASKYRYVILILVIGLVLMMIPFGKEAEHEIQTSVTKQEETDLSEQLTQILSQIQGAGKVSVMLTVKTGQNTVYQSNEDITSGDNGSIRQDTVIVTDENRVESGLIQRVIAPEYRGAIIVCEGADKPEVRLHIIEAVASVTGLGTDKISVLKMK